MKPYYADDAVTLYHGDALDVLRELPDASVDSVVTDPPYGLEFMGKEWDAPWKASGVGRGARVAAERSAELTERGKGHSTSAGPYLASGVDSVRVAGKPFQDWCEEWARECLRVLKPGGHMLAFGGTRTWHRLACAVEDAGFEVRDSIAWLYGSGFPKSLDVSKAIDKLDAVGERRERAVRFTRWLRTTGVTAAELDAATSSFMGSHYLTEREQAAIPTRDMFELIRPLIASPVPPSIEALVDERTVESDNFKARPVVGIRQRLATGREGYGFAEDFADTQPATPEAEPWQGWGTALKPAHEPIVVARKPLSGTVAANVLAHGTGALNVDGCRTATSDYTPPAGRWPANVVLDESQAAALDEQSGASQSRVGKPRGADSGDGWGMTATGTECGDSGGASRFFYVAKADASERVRVNGTAHPTVKPLALMRWLVRLVTPPGGTVLEPFAGSGTTVEACILEGFRCIAIEREADYLPLIVQRINRRRDPVAAVKASGDDGGLFDLFGEGA